MDIEQEKVRINLEEAIQAIRVVQILEKLHWNDIQFYSNGQPVDITDIGGFPTPPFSMTVKTYLEIGNFVITPKVTEEITENE